MLVIVIDLGVLDDSLPTLTPPPDSNLVDSTCRGRDGVAVSRAINSKLNAASDSESKSAAVP
jgi:hypothetical protein